MQQTQVSSNLTIKPEISAPELPEQKVAISIVVPVMNEEQSIAILFDKLSEQLDSLGQTYEIIFVDDGSTDNTFVELKKLHDEHPSIVRVIRFRRNFGKTPALVAGFERCHGEIIFTMDGDLQDDPEEIPNFLAKLDEGYDLVSGWKFPRLDPITKTFPSRIFNGMVSKMTGVQLHDINNGFKAYRREVIEGKNFKIFVEFHRFIPGMVQWRGVSVNEIQGHHYPPVY